MRYDSVIYTPVLIYKKKTHISPLFYKISECICHFKVNLRGDGCNLLDKYEWYIFILRLKEICDI